MLNRRNFFKNQKSEKGTTEEGKMWEKGEYLELFTSEPIKREKALVPEKRSCPSAGRASAGSREADMKNRKWDTDNLD